MSPMEAIRGFYYKSPAEEQADLEEYQNALQAHHYAGSRPSRVIRVNGYAIVRIAFTGIVFAILGHRAVRLL